jgi:hypothetical protein
MAKSLGHSNRPSITTAPTAVKEVLVRCQLSVVSGQRSLSVVVSACPTHRSSLVAFRSRSLLRRMKLTVLRVDQTKGVGDAVEEGKERRDVNRFGDLWVRPARLAQPFDVVARRTIGVPRD